MNSVATTFAGTASGVNNAVARTAGALSIAIVGGIALLVFASALEARTSNLNLPSAARVTLASEAAQLGAATVPALVPADSAGAVESSIKRAFVDTFDVVMWISAGLAWLSAIVAALLIEEKSPSSA
jgi:hypothetical protein